MEILSKIERLRDELRGRPCDELEGQLNGKAAKALRDIRVVRAVGLEQAEREAAAIEAATATAQDREMDENRAARRRVRG